MKKLFASSFVLLALLAGPTGTALAGSAWELIRVHHDEGGPKFTFHVSGEFSKDELNSGYVTVQGGETYPLYCAQVDAETVICHTAKKVGGHNVVVGFGGARFWTDMPEPQGPAATAAPQNCYSVWSWNESTEGIWTDYGPLCQDEPAVIYDWVEFVDMPPNPVWDNWVEFYDIDVSGNCGESSVPYNRPAYYSPACPGGPS